MDMDEKLEVINEEQEEAEDLSSSSDDSSDSDKDSGTENLEGDELNDDDDDMEEEEDDEELLTQLSETNYKLSADPFSYDLYVEKIQLLKRLGDAEALRETREKLSQLYPLNEKLWLDWIHDEMSQFTAEDRPKVCELFDRAVKDYLSIEIWLEYTQFQLGELTKENGIQQCRNLFERALSSGGLHVPMGAMLWDMYREFEGAVLGMTEPAKLEEQEQRFLALCRRQLAVPLTGMENTYKNLKNKITLDDATEANYKSAQEKLSSIQEFENKLATEENVEAKSEIYKAYAEAEKAAKSNPARRICLYERAVADCPLDSTLWLDFYEYTVGINLEDVSSDVITRASRNCPWVISIWSNYLCHLEQQNATQELIKEIFEKAILYCSTGEQAGTLWLKYLEILKRRIDLSNPNESNLELFDKTVRAADEHVCQLLEEPNDHICQILLLQVRTKIHVTKKLESGKEFWTEIYKRGYGTKFNVWLHGLNLEKEYGSGVKDLRKKYEKGLGSVKDYPQLVVDLWLNFERDYGDAKSLRSCETKIEKWMKKSQEQYQNQMQTEEYTYTGRENTNNKSFGSNKRREGFGFKRQRFDQQNQVPGKRGKFEGSRNQPPPNQAKADQVDFKTPFPPKQLRRQNHDSAPGTATAASSTSSANNEYQPEEWKLDPKCNDRTVFVSNLAITSDEPVLRNFFLSSGTVESIKLAKNFKGISKRFSYVTFSTPIEAENALKRDREPLDGRPVFIAKCQPDKSTRTKPVNFKIGLEKEKLFVKGIPISTKNEEVKELFEKYAKVKDCRLVTYKTGASKGLAYVEFFDQESARLALSKTDGLEFQGSTLMVAFSNPPKNPSKTDEYTGPSVRRAPTMFVPRSLQVAPKKPETSSTSSAAVSEAPKSNQDFRKLFQK